jgi:hypothetical protein
MQEVDWPTFVGRVLIGITLAVLALRFLFLLGARSARWAQDKPKLRKAREKS